MEFIRENYLKENQFFSYTYSYPNKYNLIKSNQINNNNNSVTNLIRKKERSKVLERVISERVLFLMILLLLLFFDSYGKEWIRQIMFFEWWKSLFCFFWIFHSLLIAKKNFKAAPKCQSFTTTVRNMGRGEGIVY